jgi:hypothetical protein
MRLKEFATVKPPTPEQAKLKSLQTQAKQAQQRVKQERLRQQQQELNQQRLKLNQSKTEKRKSPPCCHDGFYYIKTKELPSLTSERHLIKRAPIINTIYTNS